MITDVTTQSLILGDDLALASVAAWETIIAAASEILSDEDDHYMDHRTLPRAKRRSFRHKRAKKCIFQDYVGPNPLFNGREFEEMFRISRPRFEKIAQLLAHSNKFYQTVKKDAVGREGATTQAKIMIALKSLGFGVPPYSFRDYFQMSKSMSWVQRIRYNFSRII